MLKKGKREKKKCKREKEKKKGKVKDLKLCTGAYGRNKSRYVYLPT